MDRSAPSELLIRQRLRALEKNLPAAAQGSVVALHQARIASRRIREVLPVVATGSGGRRLRRQVRKIARALGPVRDLDVALQILDDLERTGQVSRAALSRLRQAVSSERQLLHADMKRRLERYDFGKLRKRALGTARRQDDDRGLARAQQRAARRAEQLRAAIDSASSIYLPDRLHNVRIAVKKLRYAMELVRELSRSRATARLRTLKTAQDLLGRIRDLEVLIARTRAVQGAAAAPNLKLSAELDRIVRRLEDECRRLHGQYISSRHSLLAICDHAIGTVGGKRAAHAA